MNPRGAPPAELTSLVGRDRELREVSRLLGRARLVSLTGPGGVGKTTVALRTAHRELDEFPDGVWFVELGSLRDPELVEPAVAATIGVEDARGYPAGATLGDKIDRWRALLILDNCEHLLDAAADLVAHLLARAPEVHVLVTSREALRVRGEHVFAINPLTTPPEGATTAEVAASDAVRLFVDRAIAVAPDFRIDDANAEPVATLIRRLDGVPLALELAAARLRALSPEEILHRLDTGYRVLATAPRGTPTRHQDLESVFRWSYEHCTPAERQLWLRMSVFAGPVGLAAVEDVCSGGEVRAEDVVDLVDSLVGKSVLTRGGGRYRMLTVVQEFGRRLLAETSGEAEVRDRHARYCGRLAEQADLGRFGPDQADWNARLLDGLPDLRIAMDRLLAGPDVDAGARLAVRLWRLWVAQGYLREGRLRMTQVLATEMSPDLRADALWVHGWITLFEGEVAGAVPVLEDAISWAERSGNARARDRATTLLGSAYGFRGELDLARELHERALAGRRDDPESTALVLLFLAEVHWAAGRFGDADRCSRECADVCAASGERWLRSYGLWMRSLTRYVTGDLSGATTLAKESLRVTEPFHDTVGILLAAEVVGWSAAAKGDLRFAAQLESAIQRAWSVTCSPLMGFASLLEQRDRCTETIVAGLGEQEYRRIRDLTANAGVPEVFDLAMNGLPTAHPLDLLTPREREVAALIHAGFSNKHIATKLAVARRTVEAHVANIMGKLECHTRVQIATWYADAAG
ncbi:helix-turn-helix transcriptional regulator [Amycolatopsis jejuensis]|uniref:helix-turn-helix transcriptional regulator n=1 Tax=Amycolatopsis jejuensis TaxID=330084 RepID=UPI000525C01F|nr:LuxR C-terminal-related transcriptional regulator [Amycolatopsis jejuensis]